MFLSLSLILFILSLSLISQFGGKLSAKNSLIWWFIFIFLMFVTLNPEGLAPLTHALGITLVSNFVFAAMIIFLIVHGIQESTVSTEQIRKIRSLTTKFAADHFLKQVSLATKTKPRALVVFPCYHEEGNLPQLLKDISLLNSNTFEIIPCIVNDGSQDQTESILEKQAKNYSTHHAVNVGVSGVLLTGFKIASQIDADFVIQCDSDGQHPLSQISNLIENSIQTKADLLIGSRYLQSNVAFTHQSSSTMRKLGSVIIRFTLKLFSLSASITDPTSGFRVYSKTAMKTLSRSMPDEYPEPESIALLLSQGLKVKEIPIEMEARQSGKSSISGFKSAQFMIKVVSALLGLRIRTLITSTSRTPS